MSTIFYYFKVMAQGGYSIEDLRWFLLYFSINTLTLIFLVKWFWIWLIDKKRGL